MKSSAVMFGWLWVFLLFHNGSLDRKPSEVSQFLNSYGMTVLFFKSDRLLGSSDPQVHSANRAADYTDWVIRDTQASSASKTRFMRVRVDLQ